MSTLQRHPQTLPHLRAHRGRGNLFLRHVERVGCIVYVLDLSGGQPDGTSLLTLPPAQQLAVLQVGGWGK